LIDIEAVRQKRTAGLLAQFPEVETNAETLPQDASEAGIDIYTLTKTRIFDHYAGRLDRVGHGGRNVADYEYYPKRDSAPEKFDRERITDDMLNKLRELVLKQEEREKERQQRKLKN